MTPVPKILTSQGLVVEMQANPMTISILEGSDSDIEIGIDFLRSNLLNWKSS